MIGSFCAVTVRKELRYLSCVPSFSVGQRTIISSGLRVTTDAGTDGKHLHLFSLSGSFSSHSLSCWIHMCEAVRTCLINHFYGAKPNISLEFWLLTDEPEGAKLQSKRRKRQMGSGNSSTWSAEDKPGPDLLPGSAALEAEQH